MTEDEAKRRPKQPGDRTISIILLIKLLVIMVIAGIAGGWGLAASISGWARGLLRIEFTETDS